MIDYGIRELLDESGCVGWLEKHLHPNGLVCPHCGSAERWLFREQGYFPAYRCKAREGYYTLLSGTVFQKSHQQPSTLAVLQRGIAKGESSARLSRELGLGGKRVMQLRHAIQNNLYETLPVQTMAGQDFEADELYQNAGEQRKSASEPRRPAWTPRQQTAGTRHLRE